MPLSVLYLVKCSISLSIVGIFYRVLLRPLTFYNLNRGYLLGASLLCLLIPFINIGPIVEKDPARQSLVIRLIPTIGDGHAVAADDAAAQSLTRQAAVPVDPWTWVLAGIVLGSVFMLIRLVIRWRSLWTIRQKARLIGHQGLRIYLVDEAIVPFSFGGDIYINPDLHSEKEWEDIILHEYTHIHQRHTIDILFAEWMCMLNWYNPFVWLLRHAIRQNLEFIADRQVLEQGRDKKKYQYHLLKVTGESRYRLANNFNFSSLKERIVMMNSNKSGRLQLVKFLFLLPLIAVLLVAFRSKYEGFFPGQKNPVINQAGIVADVNGYQPLSGVTVIDHISGLSTVSDARGYYLLPIPVLNDSMHISLEFKKEGYSDGGINIRLQSHAVSRGQLHFAMMVKDGEKAPMLYIPSYMGPEPPVVPSYSDAQAGLRETLSQAPGITKDIKKIMDHFKIDLFAGKDAK